MLQAGNHKFCKAHEVVSGKRVIKKRGPRPKGQAVPCPVCFRLFDHPPARSLHIRACIAKKARDVEDYNEEDPPSTRRKKEAAAAAAAAAASPDIEAAGVAAVAANRLDKERQAAMASVTETAISSGRRRGTPLGLTQDNGSVRQPLILGQLLGLLLLVVFLLVLLVLLLLVLLVLVLLALLALLALLLALLIIIEIIRFGGVIEIVVLVLFVVIFVVLFALFDVFDVLLTA